jgi:hydrogenase maturation factor
VIEVASAPAALAGSLRFIRYGFMPNRLRYCGPDDNRTLFQYAIENTIDGGVKPLLRAFDGALPYLQLIARSNAIADPFDDRVVEAYWIGNELLEGVEVRQLYDSLEERFGGRLRGRARDWVLAKAPAGARPHHSFHVLDIYRLVGERGDSLATMDSCRVSWGTAVTVRVARQVEARGFADDATVGDLVSLHWGWVCERLDERQRMNLERYTRLHLKLASQTL